MSTQKNSLMFADTAIPGLLQEFYAHGAERENLSFGMFGGAGKDEDAELFKIGVKNARATGKMALDKNGRTFKV